MTPRISVVMPTYNRARYLPSSVASVLEQTLPVHEILIIDDGSTDDTETLVPTLSGPIRYLRQANAGPAAARNRGLHEATGDLIALLDSDDLWLPDKLERQVAVLEARPQVGLVHTAAALIDEHGNPKGEIWGRPGYEGQVYERLLVANGINASSVLARRALLLEAGGYHARFRCLENWDLWVRVSRLCQFAYLPEPLIRYRVHSGNLISDLDRQRQNYTLWLSRNIDQADPPLPLALKRQAWARFHEAFADAWVGRGELGKGQREFVRSLLYRPMQPDVAWRLLRVSMALTRRKAMAMARG